MTKNTKFGLLVIGFDDWCLEFGYSLRGQNVNSRLITLSSMLSADFRPFGSPAA
jgi:hypothetical protein